MRKNNKQKAYKSTRTINKEHHKPLPAGMITSGELRHLWPLPVLRQNPKGYLLRLKNKHTIRTRASTDLSPTKYHHLILSFRAILAD